MIHNPINHMITTEAEIERKKDNAQLCQGWSGKALFRKKVSLLQSFLQ